MSRKLTILFSIGFIMLVAFSQRLPGMWWGLPNDKHVFSYHPGENALFTAAMDVDFFGRKLDSHYYDSGPLYPYMVSASILGATICRAINPPGSDDLLGNVRQVARMYMVGRIIALLFGIATIYLIFLLGKRAYGESAGLFAALLMSVMPLHVMHSKLMSVDIPAAFFVTLALLYAVRLQNGNRIRDYMLSGLFAGLAAAVSYPAILVLSALKLAHLTSHKGKFIVRVFSPKLLALLVMAAAGFIIGAPMVIMSPSRFLHGFVGGIVRAFPGFVHLGTLGDYLYPFTHSLLAGVGLPLLALAVLGVIYALIRRTRTDVTLYGFLFFYLIVLSIGQVKLAGYVVPVLPVLALFAARLCSDLLLGLFPKGKMGFVGGMAVIVILVAVYSGTVVYSETTYRFYTATDTRDKASDWMESNLPEGLAIGLPTLSFQSAPPLGPFAGYTGTDDVLNSQEDLKYKLVINPSSDWDADYLREMSPDFVMICGDDVRARNAASRRYLRALSKGYDLATDIRSTPPHLLWIILPRHLPSDMSYANPPILIYSRKVVQ